MKVIPHLSVRIIPHFFNMRYKLASWTRKSRSFGKLIGKLMFSEDDMVVLPKDTSVKTVDLNIDIADASDRTVLPSDVVKGIIAQSDEIFIMDFCICRKSNKCENYPLDRGCIFIGKGVRRIPDDMGHLATREEAVRYIDECSDLGLVHIIGRNKLDSIWLNTGNKKDLMTICNCCPCCCLWNMVRDISSDISAMYKRMEGVDVSVDPEICVGCGSCRDICFTKAISIVDGKSVIDQDRCRGCGRCHDRCDFDAITVTYDPDVVEKEVDRISKLVKIRSLENATE